MAILARMSDPQRSDPALPGQDLIERGLLDLARGSESTEALLVSIGAPRLRRIGLTVPPGFADAERRLYERLAESGSDTAHGRYNTLVRRLVSFERAAECAGADAARIEKFLKAIGQEAEEEVRIYMTGGATAVLYGWRASTKDIDIKIVPESDRILRALPRLKEDLEVNVELAAPDDFIPPVPGWEERSPFVAREGRASIHHYDLIAQALSKLERGHAQDLEDAREMARRGLIRLPDLLRWFQGIEPRLYRYPAIDPPSFRRAVEEFVSEPGLGA